MLAGDFTHTPQLSATRPVQRIPRRPFVNNRINPALFSPAALKVAATLPKTTDPCGRITYSRSRPQDEAQYIGKVDLQLSSNHSMFGRYMFTRSSGRRPSRCSRTTSWSRAREGGTTRLIRSPLATRWC